MSSEASSITNSEGESLLEIQDELEAAIEAALAEAADGESTRDVVDAAITETLEANGFDAAEVKSAMMGPEGAHRGGPPPRPAGQQAASQSELGSDIDDLVMKFLQSLPAGSNLDVAA